MTFPSKKSVETASVLVGIIVILASFFLTSVFIKSSLSSITSLADDNLCRALLASKSTGVGDVAENFGDLFYDIKEQCKKDYIKSNAKNEEEVYLEVAEELRRCSYRYGDGEYDFLSNWKATGNWCFLCGTIEFKNKNIKESNYIDFTNWIQENSHTLPNGTQKTYYETFNIKIVEENVTLIDEIYEDILELSEDPNGIGESLFSLSERYKEIQDRRSKQFKSDEKLFIVYRFNRVDESFLTEAKQFLTGGIGGAIAGGIAVALLEDAVINGVTWAVCGASGWWTFGLGCAPAALTTAFSAVKGTFKGLKTTTKVMKVAKITAKTKQVLFLSKAGKRAGKTAKILNSFDGSVSSLSKVSQSLDKIDTNLAKKFKNFEGILSKNNIKNIDELDNLDNVDDIVKLFEETGDIPKILKTEHQSLLTEDPELFRSILGKDYDDLLKTQSELKEIISKGNLKPENKKKIKDYLKDTLILTSAVAGGYIGASLDFNSNQYVDIMTQEQYFRECGTYSHPNKK